MTYPDYSPQPQQRNGGKHGGQPSGMTICGLVGLVLGAIAFALSFVLIINNFAFVLGLVALVLSIIGLVGTLRGKKKGKVVAIIATILSVLSLVITLVMQSAASDAIDDATGDTTSEQTSDSGDSSDSDSSDDSDDESSDTTAEGEGDVGGAYVSIVSAEQGGTDYNGDETVIVTYEWTNNSDASTSFMGSVDATAFQNGQQLDEAVYTVDPDGYDSNSQYSEIQSGATGTVTVAYVLSDDSAVSVEVSDWFNNSAVISKTFDL